MLCLDSKGIKAFNLFYSLVSGDLPPIFITIVTPPGDTGDIGNVNETASSNHDRQMANNVTGFYVPYE